MKARKAEKKAESHLHVSKKTICRLKASMGVRVNVTSTSPTCPFSTQPNCPLWGGYM
jgi:hypothetical protein